MCYTILYVVQNSSHAYVHCHPNYLNRCWCKLFKSFLNLFGVMTPQNRYKIWSNRDPPIYFKYTIRNHQLIFLPLEEYFGNSESFWGLSKSI